MAAYVLIAILVDARQLSEAFSRLSWGTVAAVLGLSVLNYILRFLRWHGYLGKLDHRLPIGRHLLYYMGGFAFTVSPGKAGEAVRSWYLKPHGVPVSSSLAALFVERLLDAIAIAMLSLFLLTGRATDYMPIVFLAAAIFGGLTWAAGHGFAPRILHRLSVRFEGRLRKAATGLARMFESSAQLLKPSRVGWGLFLGLIAWGAEGYGLYLLLDALGLEINVWMAVGIYSIAVLAGATSFFMPGGLGGMEAVMTALLVLMGSTLSMAFIVTVICRLATLWFAVILGIVSLGVVEVMDAQHAEHARHE